MFNAKWVAIIFGATFALVGLLGFIENPVVSGVGAFQTNWAHNLVHLITAAIFLAGVVKFPEQEKQVVLYAGYFYVLVAILGFVWPSDDLLGFIHINEADRWLHLGLAIAIVTGGFLSASPTARLSTGH